MAPVAPLERVGWDFFWADNIRATAGPENASVFFDYSKPWSLAHPVWGQIRAWAFNETTQRWEMASEMPVFWTNGVENGRLPLSWKNFGKGWYPGAAVKYYVEVGYEGKWQFSEYMSVNVPK